MKPTVIYYRWVYSPSTGDVTLSHNHEGHPADIRFHDELNGDRDEKDQINGYAYKVDGGWHLTDEDHKPVDDPHMLKVIDEAVQQAEGK